MRIRCFRDVFHFFHKSRCDDSARGIGAAVAAVRAGRQKINVSRAGLKAM